MISHAATIAVCLLVLIAGSIALGELGPAVLGAVAGLLIALALELASFLIERNRRPKGAR